MVNVPFFDNFRKAPTCENYIDGPVKSMAGLSMSAGHGQDDIKIPKKKKTKKLKKL